MPAGALRHSLVLEQRAQAPDGGVGISNTFSAVGTVWGDVRQVKAGTYLEGQQVESGITHTIRIRHRKRTDFNFVSRGEQRFRVRRIGDTEGRGRWLDIYAEEIRPGEDA